MECPVLGYSGQERQGAPEAGPVDGNKINEGTEASLLLGKDE